VFESWKSQKISLFSKTSWPALGPTQPSLRWGLEFFPGLRQPGHEFNQLPPFSADDKNETSCISSHKCLHGVDAASGIIYILTPL
jgi:hypothetical protein